MTEVAFHFNAPDKWVYSCRLLRKAVGRGSRVAVTADQGELDHLDQRLWDFSATDFVPHCRADCTDDAVLAASPVVLVTSPDDAKHHDVLLNLGLGVPRGFERFGRLIEVVGLEDEDREQSRLRWKFYKARGYAISRYDVAAKGAQ
jgi:DNA polymerase-3 subunit chi